MFKNTAKTTILLAAMGGLIVGVASLLGGGSSGAVMIGLFLALVMVGGSYWFSDKLALASARAQVITEADHPEFYGMVRDLSQRAGMPMPRGSGRRAVRRAVPVRPAAAPDDRRSPPASGGSRPRRPRGHGAAASPAGRSSWTALQLSLRTCTRACWPWENGDRGGEQSHAPSSGRRKVRLPREAYSELLHRQPVLHEVDLQLPAAHVDDELPADLCGPLYPPHCKDQPWRMRKG